MWLLHKLLYFALINLQSYNRTVGWNRSPINTTVTWANHLKSSPLNPPITTLITITIVTNSRDWLCKIGRLSLQWLFLIFNYDIKMTITYMSGFMKMVLRELHPTHPYLTLISLNFRPSSSQVNGQKIKKENGGQWKEDKRVEKGKKIDFPFNFYIVDFGDFWREKNARLGLDFNSSAPRFRVQVFLNSTCNTVLLIDVNITCSMTTDIIAKLARVSEKNSSSSDVTGNLCQTK